QPRQPQASRRGVLYPRPMRRLIGLVAGLALVIALPACGGKTNETKRAAGLVPSDALAYVSFSLSPSVSQKSHVGSVLQKLPKVARKSFDGLKDQLLTQAVKNVGLDYERDVKPWLGSELALAVLPGTPQPDVVALIRSNDDGKARAALDKASHHEG